MATAVKPTVPALPASSERLLSPVEAGELLQLQPSTLAQYRSKGQGPKYVRLSKNVVRYKFSDLISYIDSHPTEGTSR